MVRDPFSISLESRNHIISGNSLSRDIARLTQEHRIVYVVSDDRIDFLQARYHY